MDQGGIGVHAGAFKKFVHFFRNSFFPVTKCVRASFRLMEVFRPAAGRNRRRTCFFPLSIKERKKEERLLANSFGQVTFAFPTLDNLDN